MCRTVVRAEMAFDTHAEVSKYYAELQTSADLKTSCCTAAGALPPLLAAIEKKIPSAITDKFYGCGCPVSESWKDTGLSVLDLGSGSGRDAYLAAALLGPGGRVIGVDMTDEQIAVCVSPLSARKQTTNMTCLSFFLSLFLSLSLSLPLSHSRVCVPSYFPLTIIQSFPPSTGESCAHCRMDATFGLRSPKFVVRVIFLFSVFLLV
jgi:SAM-dependent methyltransferase